MFYDKNSGQYLSKDCQIKVLIHGEGGQRKLAGVVELDLSQYLNDKLQFKREEKQLSKCPDKHNAKISYEIYFKFERESNSETGSVIGELKRKKNKVEESKEKNPNERKKKDKKVLLLDDDIFEDDNEERERKLNKDKEKDVLKGGNPVTVYYDKQMENIKGSFNDEQLDEEEDENSHRHENQNTH